MIQNLSYQNRTKTRGEFTCLEQFNSSELKEAKISCSIIPNELTIKGANIYNTIPVCLPEDYEFYVYDKNSEKPSIDSYYSYINSELIDSDFENNLFRNDNSQSNVTIQLDESINCKLLKTKLSERRLDCYNISDKIASLFTKRGLGFYYAYDDSNKIALENRWCLVTNKRWIKQISERMKNQTIIDLINSDLRDIILSRSQEFNPDEYAKNYIISSTFLLCLQFFNERDIEIDELTEKVWDYILQNNIHNCESSISSRFEALRLRIQTQKSVISVVSPPVIGARSVFFSSFLKKIPEFIIHDRFYEFDLDFKLRRFPNYNNLFYLTQHFPILEETISDGIVMAINSSSVSNISTRYKIYESNLISFFKQSHNLNRESQRDLPIRECILDEYLISQAIKTLHTCKKHNQSEKAEYITKALPFIQGVSTQIEKLKKTLQHDFSNSWKKFIEIMVISLFPVAPKLSIYLWTEVLQKQDEIRINPNMILYDDLECEVISTKFSFLSRIFRDIEKVLKTNRLPSEDKRILKIIISGKSNDFNEELFLNEHLDVILQKYREKIANVVVEISEELFAKTARIVLK
ncbi:predicted protein [Naegleria gruberi]|uniref:Predicted protein n=1 Tax=Naegleria gruberi TaxID=5762 RepID=D2VQX9_NAEGR|nr:uncharacterized protein NAEGRDRAFT_71384 [Naegleria gruberi]EFC40716.1 predicted protein [Naegleria gruberi]|eukprot:XP_002673460.1 predicted protein [Naegleria gruberi strain NEG-M]